MFKIRLIRHAESLANVDLDIHKTIPDHNIPLSEYGIEQAKSLDLEFGENSVIYSSPYLRAVQTWSLANKNGSEIQPILEPLVAERRIKWEWGTEHYQKIIDNWKKFGSFWWDGFDHGFENGMDVYQRANIFLNKIENRYRDESVRVVVFTHGYFMQMMRIALIGDEGISLDNQRRNPDNTEQWIFRKHDRLGWILEEEKKNERMEGRLNDIPV